MDNLNISQGAAQTCVLGSTKPITGEISPWDVLGIIKIIQCVATPIISCSRFIAADPAAHGRHPK